MNILLTGASGFIGRSAARYFFRKGNTVYGMVRATGVCETAVVEIPYGNNAAESLKQAVADYDIDSVVHLAGVINAPFNVFQAGNSTLTQAVIKGLAATPDLPLVYISSVSVDIPNCAYGNEKRRCEEIVTHSSLTNWSIIRPSLVYGPGDTKNVASLVQVVTKSPVIPVLGRNDVRLQPLYVQDLLFMIEQSLTLCGTRTIIAAGPAQLTLGEMLKAIELTLGKRRLQIPISLPLVRTLVKWADSLLPFLGLPVQQIETLDKQPYWEWEKAAKLFGVQPISFEQGLNDMFDQLERNR